MFNSHQDKYFDDCPICQAVKQAEEQGRELGLSELMAAFEQARKRGAIVGSMDSLPIIEPGPMSRSGSR